jgi:hypothetical protein
VGKDSTKQKCTEKVRLMSNREMRTNFEMAIPFNGISTLLPIPPV